MQPVLVKVYGYFKPAGNGILEKLRESAACFGPESAEAFNLEGRLLLISFEGAFFPIDDVLEAVAGFAGGADEAETPVEGRLDYLDLEAWTLTRYEFSPGGHKRTSRCLNHVLDFSGH